MIKSDCSFNFERKGNTFINDVLPIPNVNVGWVKGKKNSYLNQLSMKTNTRIYFKSGTSLNFGRCWRYLVIEGIPKNVMNAKKLIHLRLDKLHSIKRESDIEVTPAFYPNNYNGNFISR